jgi:excisionase family DNA binding protein
MDVSGQIMTSAEAASVLGVSLSRVRQLAHAGEITVASRVGRSLLLDASSVNHRAVVGQRLGRALTENNAWAAIDLLTNGKSARLDGSEKSRLRSRLRSVTAAEFVVLCRRRASVSWYRSYDSVQDDLRRAIMTTAESAIGSNAEAAKIFGLTSGVSATLDGYVSRSELSALTTNLSLIERRTGNTILRATDAEIHRGGVANDVTIALDLADSLDERARDAGIMHLSERIRRL